MDHHQPVLEVSVMDMVFQLLQLLLLLEAVRDMELQPMKDMDPALLSVLLMVKPQLQWSQSPLVMTVLQLLPPLVMTVQLQLFQPLTVMVLQQLNPSALDPLSLLRMSMVLLLPLSSPSPVNLLLQLLQPMMTMVHQQLLSSQLTTSEQLLLNQSLTVMVSPTQSPSLPLTLTAQDHHSQNLSALDHLSLQLQTLTVQDQLSQNQSLLDHLSQTLSHSQPQTHTAQDHLSQNQSLQDHLSQNLLTVMEQPHPMMSPSSLITSPLQLPVTAMVQQDLLPPAHMMPRHCSLVIDNTIYAAGRISSSKGHFAFAILD